MSCWKVSSYDGPGLVLWCYAITQNEYGGFWAFLWCLPEGPMARNTASKKRFSDSGQNRDTLTVKLMKLSFILLFLCETSLQSPGPNFYSYLMYPFSLKRSSPSPLFATKFTTPLPRFCEATRKGESGCQWYGLGEKSSQYCVPGTFYFADTPEKPSVPTIPSYSTSTPLSQQSPLFVLPKNPEIASCVVIHETLLKKMI